MARGNVRVRIEGDSDGLSRETRKAETALDRLNRNGSRSMKALGTAAKVGGAAVVAGLAVGLKESADAAIEAEKSNARLRAQLKASGISYRQHAAEIENVIQKTSQLSALDDEDLQDAFTNIVRVTGNVNKSLKLTGLAADFARAKHMDVAKAGEIVGKVAGGNIGILSRYGITIKDGATATEALGALQQKFAGQAKAYGETTGGSIERAQVAAENLAEAVGTTLAPAIASVAGGIANFVNGMQNGAGAGGQFASSVRQSFSTVQQVVGTVTEAVRGFLDKNREAIRDLGRAFTNIGKGIAFVMRDVVWPVAKRVWPGIVQIVRGALRVLSGIVKVFTGVFTGDFGKMWAGIKQIFSGSLKAIGGIIRAGSAPMRAAAAFAFGKVRDVVGNVFGGIRDLVAKVIDTIAPAFRTLRDVVELALSPLRKAYNILKDIAGIAGKVVGVLGAVGGVVSKIPGVGDPKGWRERMQALVNSSLGSLPGTFKGGTWKWANQIAGRFGLHATSSYRDPKHNAAVGGVPGSLHTHGSPSNPGAIDLVGPVDQMYAAAEWARAHIPGIKEVLVHDAGSGLHLHLGFFAKGGKVHKSGLQVVGEEGPEIVSMPVGTEVFSHPDSRRMVQTMAGMLPGFAKGGSVGKFGATSYGPPWGGIQGTGITATGVNLKGNPHLHGIAVDPSVLKLGQRYWVWPNPFNYRGPFKAFDTGGAIKGNRIDFYDWRGRQAQLGWGSKDVTVYRRDPWGDGKGPGGGPLADTPNRGTGPRNRRDRRRLRGRDLAPPPAKGRDVRNIGLPEKGQPAPTDGGGGGGAGGTGSDPLEANTAAIEAHTAALNELSAQNQRLEYLLNQQSPQILDQMRALISTSMMRTVTLGRQAAGAPGRAASL